jgi:hypothetical protein
MATWQNAINEGDVLARGLRLGYAGQRPEAKTRWRVR